MKKLATATLSTGALSVAEVYTLTTAMNERLAARMSSNKQEAG